ncbi:MAG: hypothetical protein R6W82_00530 [bacterium]
MQRVLTTILIGVLPLLSGCLDMQQEIYVHGDGSARLRLDFGVHQDLLGTVEEGPPPGEVSVEAGPDFLAAARALRNDPRVRSIHTEEYTRDGFERSAIDVTVQDWRDLPEIARLIASTKEEADRDLRAIFIFELEERDGTIYFRQPTSDAAPETADARDLGRELGAALTRAVFDDSEITVTLRSPTISRSNGRWLMDKSGVEWTVALDDLVSDPLEAGAFQAEIGPSARSWHFWRVVGVILAVTILVGMLAWFRRERNGGQQAA